jgi:hypothetical protein
MGCLFPPVPVKNPFALGIVIDARAFVSVGKQFVHICLASETMHVEKETCSCTVLIV